MAIEQGGKGLRKDVPIYPTEQEILGGITKIKDAYKSAGVELSVEFLESVRTRLAMMVEQGRTTFVEPTSKYAVEVLRDTDNSNGEIFVKLLGEHNTKGEWR